jgi:hypothetical protein
MNSWNTIIGVCIIAFAALYTFYVLRNEEFEVILHNFSVNEPEVQVIDSDKEEITSIINEIMNMVDTDEDRILVSRIGSITFMILDNMPEYWNNMIRRAYDGMLDRAHKVYMSMFGDQEKTDMFLEKIEILDKKLRYTSLREVGRDVFPNMIIREIGVADSEMSYK